MERTLTDSYSCAQVPRRRISHLHPRPSSTMSTASLPFHRGRTEARRVESVPRAAQEELRPAVNSSHPSLEPYRRAVVPWNLPRREGDLSPASRLPAPAPGLDSGIRGGTQTSGAAAQAQHYGSQALEHRLPHDLCHEWNVSRRLPASPPFLFLKTARCSSFSSSVVPFSSCPQSLPASESFPMSQPFA